MFPDRNVPIFYNSRIPMWKLTFSSTISFLNCSNPPNRTALLGIDPYSKTGSPRYKPPTPFAFTVCFVQSQMPLYLPTFSSNCNWVLTYSVGYVIQISIPPVIPPAITPLTNLLLPPLAPPPAAAAAGIEWCELWTGKYDRYSWFFTNYGYTNEWMKWN